MFVSLRVALIGLLTSLLVSCTIDANNSTVRVVELIDSLAASDLYLDDVKFTNGGGFETVGVITDTPDGEQELSIRSSDGTSNVISQNIDLEKDTQSALVLAGSTASPRLYVIDETADTPSSGLARLQVINTVTSGPGYDVFVTTGNAQLATVTPTVAGTASGATSDTTDFDAGTYRVRITTGASRDLVYDSGDPASLTFRDRSVNTLVIYSSSSALLAKATLLTGAASDSAGAGTSGLTQFRMINTAVLPNDPTMGPSLNLRESSNTAFVFGGLEISNASNYKTFDTAASSLVLEGNDAGNTQYGTFIFPLQPGEDQTLLASGIDPNLTLSLIKDSNTVPRSGFANLRVINGVSGGGAAQVTVNFSNDFTGVAENTGSANYVEYVPASNYKFGIQLANGSGLMTNIAEVELVANRVYTMLFYGPVSAPQAVLLTDR